MRLSPYGGVATLDAPYWLIASRLRENDDWHDKPVSHYVIANLGSTACEHIKYYGTFDGARTQPALIVGRASNMAYMNFGRTNRDRKSVV